MYLSRVEIATNNRQKIKELTHLGAYHNWVEQSFPSEIKRGERKRHLWRLDQLAGRNYLLVLSENKPEAAQLGQFGVSGTVMIKAYDQFLNSIKSGETMQFRLTANPSYSVRQPGEQRGRVYPHVTVEEQRQWLSDHAEKAGFKLVQQQLTTGENHDNFSFDIVKRDHPTLYRKTGCGIRLSRVTFEGLLQVQNVSVFKETLINGLGREKAFGMGLMTVISEG